MRFIPTRVHAVLDYLMGMFLIVAPWILGFVQNGAETWVPVFLGVGMLLYTVCTDFEYGAFKLLSVRAHLTIDLLASIFLATSPWIFGFADFIYLPHLVLGIAGTVASLTTETVASEGAALSDRNAGNRYAHD